MHAGTNRDTHLWQYRTPGSIQTVKCQLKHDEKDTLIGGKHACQKHYWIMGGGDCPCK